MADGMVASRQAREAHGAHTHGTRRDPGWQGSGRQAREAHGAHTHGARRDPGWQERLCHLAEWVDGSTEITCTPTTLSFFGNAAKSRFYRELVAMIEAFVVDHDTGGGLFDSEGIAALKAVGGSLRTKAAVDTVRLPQALAEFIGSPLSATAKALYGSAMGFLQRRAPLEDCEAGMKLALDAFVGSLNRSVYETWLTFALIDRLGPTEFRAVSYTESGELLARPTTSLEIGFQVPLKDYRLPEALFRTASGACFAYKFECSNEIAYYKNPDKCRDLTAAGNTAGLLCHRTLLLYQVDGLETVPVLACRSNHYTVTPALLVEHLSWDELRSPQALAQARKRPLVFGPKTKLAIAVRADAAQGALTDVTIPDRLPDNLEAFAASYDGRVLDAVLGLL